MLTMKSLMHAKGFSTMEADELFFINGGSCAMDYNGARSGNAHSPDSKALAVISGVGSIVSGAGELVKSYITTAGSVWPQSPIQNDGSEMPDVLGPASPCNI
ncbi:MAG: hypothetical protein K5829_13445 [Treponema sp.]|nr:hypothetical protein [Treponema sp.]